MLCPTFCLVALAVVLSLPCLAQDYLVAAKTGEQVPFQANPLVDADGLSWHSSDSLLRPDASAIFDRIAW